MLTGLIGHKASLKLKPYQNVLFVHPPKPFEQLQFDSDAPPPPPTGQRLVGNVTLDLPKAREVSSLVVKLVASYTLSNPGSSSVENGILAEYQTRLSIPQHLEKGEHTFSWSLEVPQSAAAQCRCAYGRISQRLHAIAEGPNGTLKDDCHVQIVVNPADEGETLGLNERIEGFSEEIGPYRTSFSSGHVTVAGAVHYRLNLPSVAEDTQIHSVTTSIVQSYGLTSPSKPDVKRAPLSHTYRVFRLDGSTPLYHGTISESPQASEMGDTAAVSDPKQPKTVVVSKNPVPPTEHLLAFIPKGESLSISHVGRLPGDDHLRGTTQSTTETPIRISHELKVEVIFSTATSNFKRLLALNASRSLNISSCCCMLESLVLPSYEDAQAAEDVSPKKHYHGHGRVVECVCGLTLEKLLCKQCASMLKDHADAAVVGVQGSSDDVFVRNKIMSTPMSDSPSPTSSSQSDASYD
ncbi:hypothetical protein BKA62DRAFT_660561 [Auriculariales sp. MPI-PUGE-AT-0066]|nr:hypothetical protein BKA62DRAFT_660561 [Auriculariales sp. MPI-PUGE-AT-0066]